MIEKAKFGEIDVELKFIKYNEFASLGRVPITSVFCLPKIGNQILMTTNKRGLDFIGGHVEKDESSFQSMLRETLEESCVAVEKVKPVGAIEVYNPLWTEESPYPERSYQLFYVSSTFKVNEFEENHECTGIEFVSKEELETKHHNLLTVHKELLKLI
jgi:8-oxo-dGTP diphosphatase